MIASKTTNQVEKANEHTVEEERENSDKRRLLFDEKSQPKEVTHRKSTELKRHSFTVNNKVSNRSITIQEEGHSQRKYDSDSNLFARGDPPHETDDYESLRTNLKAEYLNTPADLVPDKPYEPPPARFVFVKVGGDQLMINTNCRYISLKEYIAKKIKHLSIRPVLKHISKGDQLMINTNCRYISLKEYIAKKIKHLSIRPVLKHISKDCFDLVSSKGKFLDMSKLEANDYCDKFEGREVYFPIIWSKDEDDLYEFIEYVGNKRQLEKDHQAVHAAIEATLKKSEHERAALLEKHAKQSQRQVNEQASQKLVNEKAAKKQGDENRKRTGPASGKVRPD